MKRRKSSKTALHPAIVNKIDKVDIQLATLSGAISVVGAIWTLNILGYIIDLTINSYPISLSYQIQLACGIILAAAGAGVRVWGSNRSAVRAENRIRGTLADTSMTLPLDYKTEGEQRIGAQINQMNDGVERLTLYRQTFIPQIASALAIPLLTVLWILIVIDWMSALVIAVCIPLIPILVGGFLTVLRKVSSNSRRARNKLAASYLDAIEGMDTLQLLGAAPRVGKELAAQGEENRLSIMRLLAKNQLVLFVVDLSFSLFIVAAAAIMAVIRISDGSISIGMGATLVFLSVFLIEPIDQVGAFFYVAMGGMAAQRSINRYLTSSPTTTADAAQAPSETHPEENPEANAEANAAENPKPPSIELENIDFGYDQVPVLQQANMSLKAGEHVAVIGPSGQGKSTLLKLIQGSLQPDSGAVLVNGKQLSPTQLRQESAMVSQRTWLFAGTVADNLRLVAPDATEEDLWGALDTAHVGDEIRSLPNGLNTVVGERGYGLSGGQAQRISIARALLSKRRLVLMDEPTSAVDLHSEALISQALTQIGDDRSMVMVTHRHGLLPDADQILEVTDLKVHPKTSEPHGEQQEANA